MLNKKIVNIFLKYFILLLITAMFLFPLLFMLSTSLKSIDEIFTRSFRLIPKVFHFENYTNALKTIPYLRYAGNTLFITVFNVVGQLLVSPMVAYSLSKVDWIGKRVVFVVLLSTMLLPYQVTMIPLYIIWQKLGLVGSYVPLILPAFFGYAFYIIILRQFFMSIPDSLLESAKIDGASEFQIYWKIMLPLCKPALTTVAIFTFLFTWSDFLGPLIYLTKQDKYTLALGLQQYMSEHTVAWEQLMAASAMFTIPIIIIFFFAQRKFIEGVVTSGLKG
ncbi:carbohydrate ABC transporter permease [bacterium]|nr:carbohydrate ABC transporter permease [Actinomycetota bacterium]MBU4313682.1 carbohydrate ABC transporter permease [Actinomycetota bacterium]MBU4563046.1 carbohydrate ABC transporter permease [bacterium]